MVASKKTHIIFRSIFLAFALVGVIGSFGTFKGFYNPDFYLYFTNISLYISFLVGIALLIDDVKKWKNNEKQALSNIAPNFRLSVFVMVFVTFVVYNTILSNPFTCEYWTNIQSLITHLVCPLMFMLDYLLFTQHRTLRLYAPFLALIMPFIYVGYILVRAEVYIGTGKMIYPYFFLNVYELGWGNVILYILGIAAIILVISYAIWAYDKLIKGENGKLKFDFSPLPKPEPIVIEDDAQEQEKEIEGIKEETREDNTQKQEKQPDEYKEKPAKMVVKKSEKTETKTEDSTKTTTKTTTKKSTSDKSSKTSKTTTKKAVNTEKVKASQTKIGTKKVGTNKSGTKKQTTENKTQNKESNTKTTTRTKRKTEE